MFNNRQQIRMRLRFLTHGAFFCLKETKIYFLHRSSLHTHALTKSPLHIKLPCPPYSYTVGLMVASPGSFHFNIVAHLLSTIFCSFGEFVLVLLFFNKRFRDPF